jgi:tetratricopeptide (TPR) repeat protein
MNAGAGDEGSGCRNVRWWLGGLAGLLLVAGGVLAWTWHVAPRPQPPRETLVQDEPDEPLVEPVPVNPGYLGPQACARCHERRMREFLTTRHAQACRVPQPENMPSGFAPGQGRFASSDPALRFEMTQSNGRFYQNTIRTTPAGEQRLASHIDLMYGTGGADEVYFSWQQDRVTELPIVWLHPFHCWGSSPFDPNKPGDCSQETTTRCLECHNTWIPHVAGTVNTYKQDHAILGITCEKCHGPGREHVAYHEAHAGADSGQAIINPSQLTRQRQMDLCAQCHSNATRPRGHAFSYRPGEPLAAYYRTAKTEHFEDDHVANQTKYLYQSKCYQKSDSLTCTSCHNPHHPRSAEVSSPSQACLKCHQPSACAEQPRLPAAVRGDCVGCHMPPRIKINIFFHTEADRYVAPIRRSQHRIGIYPEARQEVLLAWYRRQSNAQSRHQAAQLTMALVQHWLREADKFRQEYRFLAAVGAVREALRVDATPAAQQKLHELIAVLDQLAAEMATSSRQLAQGQYPEAAAALQRLLAVKPDLGIAQGKLGRAYAEMGLMDQAVPHLQAVSRYDPDNPYGEAMLGWLAYLAGKPEAALEAYRRADEIDPYNAKLHYQMGLALEKLNRWPDAAARYREVLAIDPNHVDACMSLGQALRRQGQGPEGLRLARRAVALTGRQSAAALLNLAEAYAAVGRSADAESTAAQALEVAQVKEPRLVAQISERLWQWRANGQGQ